MKKAKTLALVLALCMIATMFAGCKSTPPAPAAPETTAESSTANSVPESAETSSETESSKASGINRGGSLTIAIEQKWSTLAPINVNASIVDKRILMQVFDTLIQLDENGNYIPGLATSWDIKDDKTIVLELKQGVKFHDGTDFNAEAVKAVLDFYLDPDTAYVFKNEISDIESVEVLDNYKVQINLSKSSAVILSSLSSFSGMMVSPKSIEEFGTDIITHPVGTGPFIPTEVVEGDHIVFEKNPSYHEMGKDGAPLPYLDKLTIKVMTDSTSKAMSLMSGTLDAVDYFPISVLDFVKDSKDITVVETKQGTQQLLQFNNTRAPFNNPTLRKAIMYGIDRDELVAVITQGYGYVSPFMTMKDQWFFCDEDPYSYDPEKAKALLAEAGYPDGIDVNLSNITREPDNTIVQLLQAQLKKIGVNVTIENMERVAWVERWGTVKDGDIGLCNTTLPKTDPYFQFYTNLGGSSNQNWPSYQSAEFDALLDELKAEYDVDARGELVKQAQAQCLDDCPTGFLLVFPNFTGYRNNVKDIAYTMEGLPIVKEVWKAECKRQS